MFWNVMPSLKMSLLHLLMIWFGIFCSIQQMNGSPPPPQLIEYDYLEEPALDCFGRTFIQADLLCWKVCENSFDFSAERQRTEWETSDSTAVVKLDAKTKDFNFKWSPGFRIEAGYKFMDSNAYIALVWTNFHSHAHNESDWNHLFKSNFKFQVADMLAGYTWNASTDITLIGFGGVRWAKIDQSLREKGADHYSYSTRELGSYDSNYSDCSNSSSLVSFSSHLKSLFRACGPMLGVEAIWHLGFDLTLFANASLSILYGNVKNKAKAAAEYSHNLDLSYRKRHVRTCQSVADFGLGMGWNTLICNSIRLTLKAALEHHGYFNFNQIGGKNGDLSLDGAVFSAAIEF